eukprot:scaffold113_cov339-Pavlova_lutheri.AAC.4
MKTGPIPMIQGRTIAGGPVRGGDPSRCASSAGDAIFGPISLLSTQPGRPSDPSARRIPPPPSGIPWGEFLLEGGGPPAQ